MIQFFLGIFSHILDGSSLVRVTFTENFLYASCFILFCNLKKKIGKIDVAAVFN